MNIEYDYVVVGSGAGGGPLAANLARSGYKVLLLEAGGDCDNYNYQVPALHGRATEDENMRWDFFVQHYSNLEQQRRDSKFDSEHQGILYPRAGTLGGCTAHNAMITVYPHNSDWDRIAEITGDDSWHSEKMRKYFERLEKCQYINKPENNHENPEKHGFDGWLTTNLANPKIAIADPKLLKIIIQAGLESLKEEKAGFRGIINQISGRIWRFFQALIHPDERPLQSAEDFLDEEFDPNDWEVAKNRCEGVFRVPLATNGGKRIGTRERILEIQQQFPDHLIVKIHALVNKVLFDDQNTAIGVEYFEGRNLYQADPKSNSTNQNSAVKQTVLVNKEVILCAGTFNTPQLLKLSGIGPKEELTKLDIPVRVDLPGVGTNLQDRYEVGIVAQMKADFSILEGCSFQTPKPGHEKEDRCFVEWQNHKSGVYTTNGAVLGIIKKSDVNKKDPDLFIFGLPAFFKGYYLGYSELIGEQKNIFTWAILKAHTNNTAGTVTLKSTNPFDVPSINFHYFDEGNDPQGQDLDAVVEGVEFVRRMAKRTQLVTKTELLPGKKVETKEQIEQFIKDEAWGHHACGTCKIGHKDDKMAVLDSKFRVYGTRNLRVVDASVFPFIPGFFIVTPIYMISEKASDVILADAEVEQQKA